MGVSPVGKLDQVFNGPTSDQASNRVSDIGRSSISSLPLVVTNEGHEPVSIEVAEVLTLGDLSCLSDAVPLLNQRDESELAKSHLRFFQLLPKGIQGQFLKECKRRWKFVDTSNIDTLFYAYNARHLLNHSISALYLKYSIKTLAGYVASRNFQEKERAFAMLLRKDRDTIRPDWLDEMSGSSQKKYLFKQIVLFQTFQSDQPFYYFEIKAEIIQRQSLTIGAMI